MHAGSPGRVEKIDIAVSLNLRHRLDLQTMALEMLEGMRSKSVGDAS